MHLFKPQHDEFASVASMTEADPVAIANVSRSVLCTISIVAGHSRSRRSHESLERKGADKADKAKRRQLSYTPSFRAVVVLRKENATPAADK